MASLDKGLMSLESQKILASITASVLPADSSQLLAPLAPLQQVMPNQVFIAPVVDSMNQFPTGLSGIEVAFKTKKFSGIQNFNNTCYLNSFVQSLFITDAFTSFLYGFKLVKGEKTEDGDFNMGKTIIRGLRLLFARLLKTNHKYIEISEFIRSLPPSYRSGEQQDVTESGRWIFDKIGGTDQALVKSIFGGEMIHKTKCLGCQRVTERKEVFTDLCVSVPKESEVLGKKRVTVQSLIKHMLKPEQMTGDNKYSCENCGSKQDASRWIEITSFPTHLMLVMHKFSFDIKACDFRKEKTPVYADDGSIDLVGNKYEMYASIMHYGESAMKGHYVAIGKRSSLAGDHSSKWTLFDDSVTTPMSEAEAMERIAGLEKPTNAGYVLFFKHINAPIAVNPRMPQGCLDEAMAIEQAAVHM
jgi:ubiquitin C-terminal hydrolase